MQARAKRIGTVSRGNLEVGLACAWMLHMQTWLSFQPARARSSVD